MKAYKSAKLYYNIGEYKSAIVSLQNVIRDYPEIAQKEELDFLTLKSHFLLANNSIESKQLERYQAGLEFYAYFVGEYPGSKYQNEAKTISTKIDLEMKKINTQTTTIK
jgi:outer membrane protein assembly factor BamD